MDTIGHYHEARVLALSDIDGNIQKLNSLSNSRGEHGCWVCARVINLGDGGYRAIFFYLEGFGDLIDQARSKRRQPF
jgi:hypothetical protein